MPRAEALFVPPGSEAKPRQRTSVKPGPKLNVRQQALLSRQAGPPRLSTTPWHEKTLEDGDLDRLAQITVSLSLSPTIFGARSRHSPYWLFKFNMMRSASSSL